MKLKVNLMVNLLFRKFVFLTVVNLFLFILQLSGAHKVKIKLFQHLDAEHIQMICRFDMRCQFGKRPHRRSGHRTSR